MRGLKRDYEKLPHILQLQVVFASSPCAIRSSSLELRKVSSGQRNRLAVSNCPVVNTQSPSPLFLLGPFRWSDSSGNQELYQLFLKLSHSVGILSWGFGSWDKFNLMINPTWARSSRHYINVLIQNFLDLYWDRPSFNLLIQEGDSQWAEPCRAFLILTPLLDLSLNHSRITPPYYQRLSQWHGDWSSKRKSQVRGLIHTNQDSIKISYPFAW